MNGPTIGAAFGCAWGIAGAAAMPSPWRAWAIGSSIAISIGLLVALGLRPKHPALARFRSRIYGISVVLEVAAIFGSAWLLTQFGAQHSIMPAIGFIVGLHFLGLWKATDRRVFLWTALAMCLVCGIAAFLPSATTNGNLDLGHAVTGLGSALVLWVASASSLVSPDGRNSSDQRP